jgi:hypothetical protein
VLDCLAAVPRAKGRGRLVDRRGEGAPHARVPTSYRLLHHQLHGVSISQTYGFTAGTSSRMHAQPTPADPIGLIVKYAVIFGQKV